MNLTKNTTKTNFLLTFRSLSEIFIRWSWYSELPVLDTLRKLRVKKTVVAVAEGKAPLISVDCTLAVLTDVHGFLDPSREAVRFPVNDGSIRPVDEMVFLSHMVSEGGFIVLCLWSCPPGFFFALPPKFPCPPKIVAGYVPVIACRMRQITVWHMICC